MNNPWSMFIKNQKVTNDLSNLVYIEPNQLQQQIYHGPISGGNSPSSNKSESKEISAFYF